MNVRVYLKPEFGNHMNHNENIKEEYFPSGGSKDSFSFFGTKGIREAGDSRWLFDLPENEKIHPDLIGFVDEVSIRDSIPNPIPREAGVYQHKTAEGEIEYSGQESSWHRPINIKAKKLEDALELLHQIKAGTIRPAESYEGNQTGMSRKKMESRLKFLEGRMRAVQEIRTRIHSSSWPFCLRQDVLDQLEQVADPVG